MGYSLESYPVDIAVENARTLVIKCPKTTVTTSSPQKASEIIELHHSSGFTINISDIIKVNNSDYKIQKIDKKISEDKSSLQFYLRTHKLNKTSQLIVPLLGLTRKQLLYDRLFCNAFIGHVENNDYGDHLYLLYRFEDSPAFQDLEADLLEEKVVVSTINVDDYQIMFKLNLPHRFVEDVKLILEGKYSLISDEAKFCILKFLQGNKDTLIGQILFKSPTRKRMLEESIGTELPNEAELLSAFLPVNEVYFNKFNLKTQNEREKISCESN
jgi:hypothetical protein